MSNPVRSLNARLDCFSLLEHLGFATACAALPRHAICPLCRTGAMKLYDDHAGGGQWFHCPDCGRCGDMIELAAGAWGLSPHGAIAKLRSLGYDVPGDAGAAGLYVEGRQAPRRRTSALWKHSRRRWNKFDFGLNHLMGKLRLYGDVPRPRRPEGPGLLFGAADKSDVERCFAPRSMQHAERRNRRSNPSEHAVFRGAGWEEVLVVPYFDLPGRISAFMLVGREGDPERDCVFKLVNRSFRGNQHVAAAFEAGLCMHPRTLDAADRFERTVVAYHNPLVTLPLQVRYFSQSLLPLPLVTWHDSARERPAGGQPSRVRTHHAWQLLDNRQLVFWMPAFRLETLRQAIEQNALISTVGPQPINPRSFQEYLWRQRPGSLYRHIVKTARPWSQALSRHMEMALRSARRSASLSSRRRDAFVRSSLLALIQSCRSSLSEMDQATLRAKARSAKASLSKIAASLRLAMSRSVEGPASNAFDSSAMSAPTTPPKWTVMYCLT